MLSIYLLSNYLFISFTFSFQFRYAFPINIENKKERAMQSKAKQNKGWGGGGDQLADFYQICRYNIFLASIPIHTCSYEK